MILCVLFNFLLFVTSHNVGGRNSVSWDFREGVLLSLSFRQGSIVILDSLKGGKLLIHRHAGRGETVVFVLNS